MRLSLIEGLIVSELPDDEMIIATPDAARALFVNSIGSAVVELCDGTRNVAEIADFLCRHLEGADPDGVLQDVRRFADELREAGMISSPDPCGESPSEC